MKKQLDILKRIKPGKCKFKPSERSEFSALALVSSNIKQFIAVFKPKTLLDWQRERIRKFWTFDNKSKRIGRPPTPEKLKRLVFRMNAENMDWGSPRIAAELTIKPGFKIDQSTVFRIFQEYERKGKSARNGLTWSKFLKGQINSFFATDFLAVDTFNNRTYYVMFIIRHKTREIVKFAITQFSNREYVRQQFIQFKEDVVENFKGKHRLIHDNASQFWFDFSDYGIESIRTAFRSPKML